MSYLPLSASLTLPFRILSLALGLIGFSFSGGFGVPGGFAEGFFGLPTEIFRPAFRSVFIDHRAFP